MFRITFWLSLLLIFFVPWERIVHIQGLGTISNIMGFLVAVAWGLHGLTSGVRRPTLFHAIVLAFVAWNGLSIYWSVDPDRSLLRIGTYARLGMLTIIVWDLYRTTASIHWALQAFVFGGLVPAMSTVGNYLAGVERSHGRFSSGESAMNAVAYVLALTVPAALYLAIGMPYEKQRSMLKLFNFAYVFLALFAISLTASRFALIMLAPAGLYVMVNLFRMGLVQRMAIVVGCLIGVLIVVKSLPEVSLARLGTVKQEITSGDLTGRTAVWKLGLQSFAKYPWVGVGAGAQGSPTFRWFGYHKSLHNSFLAILVELGVVGGVIFLAILASAILHTWSMPQHAALFWLMVLGVWFLGNLPVTTIYTKESWLMFGLLVADANAHRKRAAESSSDDLA